MNDEIWQKLRAPFEHDEVGWVPIASYPRQAKDKDLQKVLLSPYADARAVQQRLDDVVGPENWKAAYEPGPDGGVLCALSIRVGDEWITKCDAAENTAVEPVRGGISQAFKRAAVAWGIGRYLYGIAPVWAKVDDRGRWPDPVLPATAGSNPPNHNREPATQKADPKAVLAAKLKEVGFGLAQVTNFFQFIADQEKCSTIGDVPAGKLQQWVSRMQKNSNEQIKAKVEGALAQRGQEAA